MQSTFRSVALFLTLGLAVTAMSAVAQDKSAPVPAAPAPVALQFVPLIPCRVVDTRTGSGGPIQAGTSRSFPIPIGPCKGIPLGAYAFSLNVAVVPDGPLHYLTVWPTGQPQPLTATLNSLDGRIKANATIVAAGNGHGGVSVFATDTTNVILDIDGFFVPAGTLAFYSMPPCRLADTRPQYGGSGPIPGGTEQDFSILNVPTCEVPATAQAYSLNFSAVPPGPLGYLTVWPTGSTKPLVSTLNDLTGTIVANAAILSAGAGGKISVYPSNETNVVIDINGYFAPPGAPGALSLYLLSQCRVLDSRQGIGDFSMELTVPVVTSPCNVPSTAQAYVLNATVVPDGALGYLTLWADGAPQPVVSTLNALDGAITNNMAIVPTTNGSIDAYASGTTQLILDISNYFAP
jgi:hypothetical protein